ncbi:MAG: O-antigen ligase family protein [Caulobacterales bacterium]|nr:O-antigen ligase family protein [Caulobacterales bacterium]
MVIPVLLAIAVILGGAGSGTPLADGVLQMLALLILATCVLHPRLREFPAAGRPVLVIAAAFAAVVLLQLIPLPAVLWTAIPGRDAIAETFAIAEMAPAWAPLSLTPEETFSGLLRFLPPLALFVLAAKLSFSARSNFIGWGVPMIAAASVFLGLAQVYTGGESNLYIYLETNYGRPVGFFANVNHQATFLLMTLPFIAFLAVRIRARWARGDADYGRALAAATLGSLVILGVMTSGSVAGYLILGPVLIGCYFIVQERRRGAGGLGAVIVAGAGLAGLAGLVATSPVLISLGVTDITDNPLSRRDIFARTFTALIDHFPAGTGLGSFEKLFPLYEDAKSVTIIFVNHAHNDYLEFVLELGAPGVLLLAAFLFWLARETGRIWMSRSGSSTTQIKKAASIAIAVVALHSLVEFPLRTPGIAAFAGLCLALLIAPGREAEEQADAAASEPDPSQRVSL